MEQNALMEQKKTNLMQALNREESSYLPNLINNATATIAWTGKTTVEVNEDPVAYVKALNAVFEEMWVDARITNGNIFSTKMERAFNTLQNKFGPDGTTPLHIQESPMKADEYDQFIADLNAFVAEVLLPRRHPQLFADREEAKRALKLYAEDKFYSLVQLAGMADQDLAQRFGVVPLLDMQKRFETPIDMLFDHFRGFRGTLTDLRRQPDKVRAALDKLWEVRCGAMMEAVGKGGFPYAVQFPHIPAYLSPKQFDELYWVHEKQFIERIAAAGGKAYLIMEGRWEKIWHRFLELPKDSCLLHVDDDDILKAKAELGHHQILVGGLKTADTRLKTFDQIKDDIKKVVDVCAPGGGFLFSTDKCWITPGDVNRNLVDAFNFVHEYTNK